MRRREFIAAAGAAAFAWPLVARAQPSALPAIGFLRSTPYEPFANLLAAFRAGLKETGFVDGRNVTIEQRYADNHNDRLPTLAADLIRRRVAAIVGNIAAVKAARAATTTIPILFVVGNDPVKAGLVTNLRRPEANLTGVTFFGGDQLNAKRVELLSDLVPGATVIAALLDPNYPGFEAELPNLLATGRAIGKDIVVVKAANERELGPAFATIAKAGACGLLVSGSPFFTSRRREVVALAARHAIPAIYDLRDFAVAGGLISYSASITDAYRQAGIYAGRILRGAKPSDLPVVQPTTVELVVNVKTAKALGLTVPPSILARADEVIE